MPNPKNASALYKRKISHLFTEEHAIAIKESGLPYVGLRPLQEKIYGKLMQLGWKEEEIPSALDYPKLSDFKKEKIIWKLSRRVLEAIADYKGVSAAELKDWLEDDSLPVEATPWKSDVTPEMIASLKKSLDAPPAPTKNRRSDKPVDESVVDIAESIQRATDREIVAAAPVLLNRLFSNAQVFITIVPGDVEIPQETLAALSDVHLAVVKGNTAESISRADEDMNTHEPGDGQVAAYVQRLFAENGRDINDPRQMHLLNASIQWGLGEGSEKKQLAEGIKSVLQGIKPRFSDDEEDYAIHALAQGLSDLFGLSISFAYLTNLNRGYGAIDIQQSLKPDEKQEKHCEDG